MNLRTNEKLIREVIRTVKESPACRERSKQYAMATVALGIGINPEDKRIIDEITEVGVRYLVSLGEYDECLLKLADSKKSHNDIHSIEETYEKRTK